MKSEIPMTRHFPYVSAVIATAAVGAITSVAGLGARNVTSAFAAQVRVVHPVAVHGANLASTLGMGAMALPPAFGSSAGMNHPGQPAFGQMLYGLQTTPTPTQLPNSIGMQGTLTYTGSSVGFYEGFGPGNPGFGFFAGFTTPR
jgi:hypothetical protein